MDGSDRREGGMFISRQSARPCYSHQRGDCPPTYRGGGGGTDSLSLGVGTNCESTPIIFGQAPVLLPPNLQPPLFMDAQEQLLEINSE